MSTKHSVQRIIGVNTSGPTSETVILSIDTPPQNQPLGLDGIVLKAALAGTAGSGATNIIMRARKNGLTGPQIGNAFTEQVSSLNAYAGFGMFLDDTTVYPQGMTYVITVQQVSAIGVGINFVGCVTTMPCSPVVG